MDAVPTPDSDARSDAPTSFRSLALFVVLGSGLVALSLGFAALGLVREQLHIRCGMGQPGSEGADTWTCSDGIGYLGVAVTLGAMWFLVVLLGALAAAVIRRERVARTVLVLLAGASTAWILGWTWYGSSALVDDQYAPMDGTEYWALAVGPAAITSVAGFAVALASLMLSGRPARVAGAIAASAFVIATLLQPGLSINTIPAAGLLAAAALRVPTSPSVPPVTTSRYRSQS